MTTSTWYVLAIIIYLFVMLAIGFWSYKQTSQYDEYVLGGRGLNPFVAALSAGASDMSGWLLMGLPGALFLTGFSELWMAIGLTVGGVDVQVAGCLLNEENLALIISVGSW